MRTEGNDLDVLEAVSLSKNKKALQEYAFLSQIADMYYNKNMQQADIARELFFSRSTVSRLLARARETGIVDIRVRQVRDRIPSMEEIFCRTFGLRDAVIISSFEGDSYDRTLDALTDFASIYTSNLLKGKKRIGIASGASADRTIRKIHPIHDCRLEVIQLIGTVSNAHQAVEARDLRVHLAELFNGSSYELSTPIYMDNPIARSALLQDPNVRRVMDMMAQCDIILTGLGNIDVSRLKTAEIIREYQTEAQAQELKEKGAVGCVCMMYYDINGDMVPCEWNEKCISLHLEEVRKNHMTVAVACGEEKTLTILGALRGKIPNVLITDVETAARVLKKNEELFG